MAAHLLLGPEWSADLLPGLLLAGAIAGAEWAGYRWTLRHDRNSLKQCIQGAGDAAVLAAGLLPLFLFLLWIWRARVLGAPMRLTTEALTPALVLAHLGLVALPEELFFRAYVQRALGDAWGRPWRFLGARLGPGWVTAAILFGIVHLPVSGGGGLLRIAPALVFGWLYARRTCVAGPILFHWACNVAILCVAPKSGYLPGS